MELPTLSATDFLVAGAIMAAVLIALEAIRRRSRPSSGGDARWLGILARAFGASFLFSLSAIGLFIVAQRAFHADGGATGGEWASMGLLGLAGAGFGVMLWRAIRRGIEAEGADEGPGWRARDREMPERWGP